MVRASFRELVILIEEPSIGSEQTLCDACGYFTQFWRDRLVVALRRKWDRSLGVTVYDQTVAIPTETIERIEWIAVDGTGMPDGDPFSGFVSVPYQAGG